MAMRGKPQRAVCKNAEIQMIYEFPKTMGLGLGDLAWGLSNNLMPDFVGETIEKGRSISKGTKCSCFPMRFKIA